MATRPIAHGARKLRRAARRIFFARPVGLLSIFIWRVNGTSGYRVAAHQ